jgi:hypothetical protein
MHKNTIIMRLSCFLIQRMPGYYLKLGHYQFLKHPFRLIIH